MMHSSTRAQDFEVLARRKSVAQWIENLTGVPVPTSSDYSFRSALKDGVLLCRVMNQLVPYSVPKIVDVIDDGFGATQISENIDSFLAAAEKFGMSSSSLFSLEDILEGAWEERPKVAECLYQLERKAEQLGIERETDQLGYGHSMMSGGPYYGLESVGSGFLSPDPYRDQYPGSPDSYRQVDMIVNNGITPGSDGKPKGVVNLVQQCTSILRERMVQDGVPSPGPGSGPVPMPPAQPTEGSGLRLIEVMLKQILSGITTAQEKRGQTDVEHMEKYIRSLESQIDLLSSVPPPPEFDGGFMPEEVENIQRTAEELSRKLDEYERINWDLEQSLENEKGEKRTLRQQLEDLRRKLGCLDNLQEKYNQIQEENRKLYNQVQDLKGSIRVFCRVRPLGATGDNSESCIDVGMDGEVAICGRRENDKRKVFTFDRVFDMKSTQNQIYNETQPLIRSVLDGYNVCIFAYGQTGSGKTHTMSGTNVDEYEGRGINYRALDDLFGIKKARVEEFDYDIQVQMLEIYNEVLRDLLIDEGQGKKNRLEIRSTEKSGLNVPDATQMPVNCTEDVLEFMEIGARNRAVGQTKMNERSSRSHSIVTVIVSGLNRATGVRSHGCLHLVDLAGSERVSRSEASGERLVEAQHINKSLSALGDVMAALAQKSNHIPFRNSKLTQLLQDSLSGQAKAMMFMHIAPEASSRGETQSTLMFGARVSQITLGQARQNTESAKIFEARDAMARLQQKAEKKQQEIEELHRVVETERQAAKTAISEKEAMEREMAQLREELATHRSVSSTMSDKQSIASSAGGESRKEHRRNNKSIGDAPPSARDRGNKARRSASSEVATSVEKNPRRPMPRPSLDGRTLERYRDGSLSHRSMSSQNSTRGDHSARPSEKNRKSGSSGSRSGIPAADKSQKPLKTPRKSSSEKVKSSSSSTLTRSLTSRELTKGTNAAINPRRAALNRSSSIGSNGSVKLSARDSLKLPTRDMVKLSARDTVKLSARDMVKLSARGGGQWK